MRIAVTYDNGTIFQHFGHTQQFMIYDTSDGKITAKELLNSGTSGHGALAGLLGLNGVNALICGGIGPGAQAALEDSGIRLYCGVTGNADNAVEALLAGTLHYEEAANCSHHEGHSDEHQCGEHSCGEHRCGHNS